MIDIFEKRGKVGVRYLSFYMKLYVYILKLISFQREIKILGPVIEQSKESDISDCKAGGGGGRPMRLQRAKFAVEM
jgi:hypothetical protein